MRLIACTLVLALGGCASDYEIGSATTPQPAVDAPSAAAPSSAPSTAPSTVSADRAPEIRFEHVDVSDGPTSALFAREATDQKLREERYAIGGGATSPVVDYLFVIDHSVSMDKVLDKMRAGMRSLAEDGALPSKARIAVMSTLPGDPTDLSRPHPSAIRTAGLDRDPGFLRLVDGEGIAAYREAAPIPVSERFQMDGCGAWFAPTETSSSGDLCLLAHTQIGLTAVGVEAGLVAFGQFLDRAEEPVFRPGAAVNVIFVSDTHDPGIPLDAPGAGDLKELRPDFAELADRVHANSLVSSFRVHAIAPSRPCVEGIVDGPTYRLAARDGGGVNLDVCTATDYRPLIEKIARTGAVVQRPVFPLGRAADEVQSVVVDGRPVGFSVSADGGVLVLDRELPRKKSRVAVRYRYR